MSLLRDAPVPEAVAVMSLSPWTKDAGRSHYYNTELRDTFPAYFCLLDSCLESQEPVKGAGETLPLPENSAPWKFNSLRGMYPKAMYTLLMAGEAVSSSVQRATFLLVKLSCGSKIGHFKELSLVLHNLIVKSFSVYCRVFKRIHEKLECPWKIHNTLFFSDQIANASFIRTVEYSCMDSRAIYILWEKRQPELW